MRPSGPAAAFATALMYGPMSSVRTVLAKAELAEAEAVHKSAREEVARLRKGGTAVPSQQDVAAAQLRENLAAMWSQSARLKLTRVDLFRRFSFGGFGCDHEDRALLIRTGAQRGAAQLGQPLERCRVVVIGDTPKDVSAALALGGECIGVGTGSFTPEALKACGATHAFRDLSEPGAVTAMLRG